MSDRERTALDRAAERQELFLPAISLWEAQNAPQQEPDSDCLCHSPTGCAGHRLRGCSRSATRCGSCHCARSGCRCAFHGDPADRLVVATAERTVWRLRPTMSASGKSRAVRLWTAGRPQRVAPAPGVQEQAARYGPGHILPRGGLTRRRDSAPRRSFSRMSAGVGARIDIQAYQRSRCSSRAG